MPTFWRHAFAILVLPGMVVVGIPCLLVTTLSGIDSRWGADAIIAWPARGVAVMLLISGLLLFAWCISLFVRVGRGTLAAWDATRNLVTVGPYARVRNPMISGVALMLLGESLFWGSWLLGLWACGFVVVNQLYFVLSEEPGLERRFGQAYRDYKARVARWIPHRRR